jgi:hypothetical protein
MNLESVANRLDLLIRFEIAACQAVMSEPRPPHVGTSLREHGLTGDGIALAQCAWVERLALPPTVPPMANDRQAPHASLMIAAKRLLFRRLQSQPLSLHETALQLLNMATTLQWW